MEYNVPHDLSKPQRDLLAQLLEMYIEGEELTGLRFGKEVCEHLTELSSLDFFNLEDMEEEEDVWRVDLELGLSEGRAEELVDSL